MKLTSRKVEKFNVPVYPHLKKFILKNYKDREPLRIEDNSMLGKMITLALYDNRNRSKHKDQHPVRMTERLVIILSEEQQNLHPGIDKLVRINVSMDRIFKEHLMGWIQAMRTNGMTPFKACRMFLDHYGINGEEYSVNTAYKYYQRNKGG